jgi:hypothetical protein
MKRKHSKAYYEGRKAYRLGIKWTDCPYKIGTQDYQSWVNGKSDAGDKDMLKLFKMFPNLLRGY